MDQITPKCIEANRYKYWHLFIVPQLRQYDLYKKRPGLLEMKLCSAPPNSLVDVKIIEKHRYYLFMEKLYSYLIL